jgi:microcystin-dependent protein
MTQYVKSTSFTSKDTLPSGNPLKILKGTEIDVEFDGIAVAVNSKADKFSPTFTGTPLAPTASFGNSSTQIATTAFATAYITPFTGTILMWPTATAPSGFILCNGQLYNRGGIYGALFALIGTTYGSGDSTNFAVPNFTDRMPICSGNAYPLNQRAGSADSTLPSHTHTASVNDPGHFHQSRGNVGGADVGILNTDSDNGLNYPTSTAFTGITVTNASAGVSATNANLPPYIGIYFIIKL